MGFSPNLIHPNYPGTSKAYDVDQSRKSQVDFTVEEVTEGSNTEGLNVLRVNGTQNRQIQV